MLLLWLEDAAAFWRFKLFKKAWKWDMSILLLPLAICGPDMTLGGGGCYFWAAFAEASR